MRIIAGAVAAAVLLVGNAAPAEGCAAGSEWAKRSIYFIMTDRFAGKDHAVGGAACMNERRWCGGTFEGIESKLDYIQGMGFDAIWITPVVQNTLEGYTGYWAKDWYSIEPHLGTAASLKSLVAACHERGMWVMVDVVANHVGYPSAAEPLSTFNPFNDSKMLHPCSGCGDKCSDLSSDYQRVNCRLAGLPDLNQTEPVVSGMLTKWVAWLIGEFDFDGVRVDTVQNVQIEFWPKFNQASAGSGGHCFTMGEVFNGDANYVARYQGKLDGVLHYPFYYIIQDVFRYRNTMTKLQDAFNLYRATFRDTSILGLFLDNHDKPRFLGQQPDSNLFKNALVTVLLQDGIPIIYYGTEQGFTGGNDPYNRKPLWVGAGYDTRSQYYQFLKTVVGLRRKNEGWAGEKAVQRYADSRFYAWSRGDTLVLTTNVGSSGPRLDYNVTYLPSSYRSGDLFCNIFWPTKDCVKVARSPSGSLYFPAFLNGGEVKIFVRA